MNSLKIFDDSISFDEKAFEVFEYQKHHNSVYSRFCKALGIDKISSIEEIPLLPIQAFKEKEVVTATRISKLRIKNLKFLSSGTSGMSRSQHIVTDPTVYKDSILKGMSKFYDLSEFIIWAYTPGYNANPNSSLIWMLNALIEAEDSGSSKFLDLEKPLNQKDIDEVKRSGKRLMIFGAAFGLLDLLEISKVDIPKESIVIETGGMKTFRREMTKSELHQKLAVGFDLPEENIHSEYGMTELLSQAYSFGGEWFECVPWMKVTIRKPDNPLEEVNIGEEGLIGVIDLANLNSCSFILTGDKGVMSQDGRFQVLGRWIPKNLRGCNFLIDQD